MRWLRVLCHFIPLWQIEHLSKGEAYIHSDVQRPTLMMEPCGGALIVPRAIVPREGSPEVIRCNRSTFVHNDVHMNKYKRGRRTLPSLMTPT
jgi:hypothetical protein